MAGFSELIKSFDKTRDYMRDFFIYGCRVRNDFCGKSSRTYDDEKRRIESWLGDNLRFDSTQRGKTVSISVDSSRVSENPLYKAFRSKSFTDNDIKLHFLLTDILSDGESLSLKDIVNRLADDYSEIFEEQTVRIKLKEYCDEGIFIKEKQGKTDYFSLSQDTVQELFSCCEGLDDAVKFASESCVFGVVGNSLLKAAGLENDIILNKHNYIVHTLEDEIMLDLISAIDDKRSVEITHFSRGGQPERRLQGVPFKILSSVQTGRRYLAMYSCEFSKMNSVRLDSIRKVRKCGVREDYDKLYEEFLKCESRCFGVSLGKELEAEPFKLEIYADEETEDYIIARLEREKRCGRVERLEKNVYLFTADVADPNEIMQWAKSFIGRIISVSGGTEEMRQLFLSDIERMSEMYLKEGQHEHLQ